MVDVRRELVLRYIRNKSVLEFGIGDGEYDLLHDFVKRYAKNIKSVELDSEKVSKFTSQGYDVVYGDVQDFRLQDKYDVILAGEIIEHVNNAGLMLTCALNHLNNDGVIIITTPNLYSINLLLRGLLQGGNVELFHEHSLGFTEPLIKELLTRYNLEIKEFTFFNSRVPTLKNKILNFLTGFCPRWKEYMFIVARFKYDT
jgi:2-polyprenyl-3-methyl-5-hydroxy-6-metoxy-1,4-benzoquinol methylase